MIKSTQLKMMMMIFKCNAPRCLADRVINLSRSLFVSLLVLWLCNNLLYSMNRGYFLLVLAPVAPISLHLVSING